MVSPGVCGIQAGPVRNKVIEIHVPLLQHKDQKEDPEAGAARAVQVDQEHYVVGVLRLRARGILDRHQLPGILVIPISELIYIIIRSISTLNLFIIIIKIICLINNLFKNKT